MPIGSEIREDCKKCGWPLTDDPPKIQRENITLCRKCRWKEYIWVVINAVVKIFCIMCFFLCLFSILAFLISGLIALL